MSAHENFAMGQYIATRAVSGIRRNLFCRAPGRERHIGTLIGGCGSGADEGR